MTAHSRHQTIAGEDNQQYIWATDITDHPRAIPAKLLWKQSLA
jgi:hypothetical protein